MGALGAQALQVGVGDSPQAAGAECRGARAGRSIKPGSASNSGSCSGGEGQHFYGTSFVNE